MLRVESKRFLFIHPSSFFLILVLLLLLLMINCIYISDCKTSKKVIFCLLPTILILSYSLIVMDATKPLIIVISIKFPFSVFWNNVFTHLHAVLNRICILTIISVTSKGYLSQNHSVCIKLITILYQRVSIFRFFYQKLAQGIYIFFHA